MNKINIIDINPALKNGIYFIEFNGIKIQFRYRSGINNTLIILFTGSVDRTKREIPFFKTPYLDLATVTN
jgi:hypothetical protein